MKCAQCIIMIYKEEITYVFSVKMNAFNLNNYF